MSRVILHGMNHPFVVKLKHLPGIGNITKDEKVLNYEIHLCACGLSKNKPFCDGHHAKTMNEKPEPAYIYDDDGNVVTTLDKLLDPSGKELNLPKEYE